MGARGPPLSSQASLHPVLPPRSLLQELRELREQQDAAKAALEQLVATTAGHLQEQVGSRRGDLSVPRPPCCPLPPGRPPHLPGGLRGHRQPSREPIPSPRFQLDELRSLLGTAGPDTSPTGSPGGAEPVPAECPVCSADVGAQLGQLLRRYEQLQELVDSVLARQAVGKASRQLPGRRWVRGCRRRRGARSDVKRLWPLAQRRAVAFLLAGG